MGNFISINVVRRYNPGLANRDMANEAKTISVADVDRALVSSYCMKYTIKKEMQLKEIRTAHIENLVEAVLNKHVANGDISQEIMEKIGSFICSKEIIGTDCWNKRDSLKTTDGKKTDKKEEAEEKAKGNQVVVTSDIEMLTLINSVIDETKSGWPEGKKDLDKLKNNVISKLHGVHTSVAKALFGSMSTGGLFISTDGAVEMGHTFSLDAFFPAENDFVANSVLRTDDGDDPFYGGLADFVEKAQKKPGAETMGSSQVYSNSMYTYSNISVNVLKDRLMRTVTGKYGNIEEDAVRQTILEIVPEYIKTLCTVMPSAQQHSGSSHVIPTIVFIEGVKEGNPLQLEFDKVLKYDENNNKSVSEQAVEKFLEYIKYNAFLSNDTMRYVILGPAYMKYAKDFEKAGVIVIHNLSELVDTMTVLAESMI